MKFLAKDFLHLLNPANEGVVPRAVETGEYMLSALGIGYLQNRYRDRMAVAGVPANLLVGGLMKLGALAMDLKRKSGGTIHSQLHILGNVGLVTWAHAKGAGMGAAASGVRRALVRPEDVKKVLAAAPATTLFGEIPKAPKGDFLSTAQLADMAR
jgi:hypothetical protein